MKISLKTFIKQLVITDLFGKDSHRGVSLTYAWLANQLGHFTLGFVPSIILSILYSESNSPIFFSTIVASVWLGFEIINLLVPIFLKKQNKTFKPYWGLLIFDTTTDVFYFALGAAISVSVLVDNNIVTWIVYGLLIALLYPFIYWYTSRIYQQYAYFPFQFRLSQWKGNLDNAEKETVRNYIKNINDNKDDHLLIFGNVNEGKSNLGVAIANEMALRKKSCFYITATKLYSLFVYTPENKDLLWNWKDCEYLVIDDINPDNFDNNELTSPAEFLIYIDTFTEINTVNRNILKNKNVIWVLGTNEKIQEGEWNEMLKTIGVKEKNIHTINLSD